MTLKASPKSLARIINIEFLTSSLGNLFKAVFHWGVNTYNILVIKAFLYDKSILMECCNYENKASQIVIRCKCAIKQIIFKNKFRFLWISQECYIHLPTWKSSAYSGRQKHLFSHWYDTNSERMVRTSGEHEAIYVSYRASRVQN